MRGWPPVFNAGLQLCFPTLAACSSESFVSVTVALSIEREGCDELSIFQLSFLLLE